MESSLPNTTLTPAVMTAPSYRSAPPEGRRGEGARIYGFSFDWYLRQITKPAWYGSLLATAFTLLAAVMYGAWADGADAFSFIVKLAVWVLVGWRIMRGSAADAGAAAVAAGMAGIAMGLALALVRMVLVREFWTVFNLMVEPVVTGVFGYCIGGAAAWAAKPFRRTAQALQP